MTYEEFQKELLNHLQRKCGKGVTPELTHQLKENGLKKTGITLRFPDTISSPIIYLEDFLSSISIAGIWMGLRIKFSGYTAPFPN